MTVLLLLSSLAFGAVEVEPPPRVGETSTVRVTGADGQPRSGVTVRVFHRPGLEGERELAVGITDGRGRVRWTPERGGVADVKADDERVPVAVAWSAPPPVTVTLLGLLGAAGLGGLVFGVIPSRWRSRPR